jgi:hypothetical protein
MLTVGRKVTLTYKGQTGPLVREGAPRRQDSNFQTKTFGQKVASLRVGSIP